MAHVLRRGSLLLCLLLAVGLAEADETTPPDLYVRGLADVAATARWLEAEAERIDAAQILLVLDASSFAPPPEGREFTLEHDFRADLDAWIEALWPWSTRTDTPIRVTSSIYPFSIHVGDDGWEGAIRRLVARAWWEEEHPAYVEPAATWMARLVERTQGGLRPGCPRLLAWLTGTIAPERWLPRGTPGFEGQAWRGRLLPVGRYVVPAAIAKRLQPAGVRLYVVAPEAPFGEHVPRSDLPALPWASRPLRVPVGFNDPIALRQGPQDDDDPAGPGDAERRRLLDELLRDVIPDPVERRRRVDEMMRAGGALTPRPRDALLPTPGLGGRFSSCTPVWREFTGLRLLRGDDTPSGYGWWPLARAAHLTRGRYVFYPTGRVPMLESCAVDEAKLRMLEPALCPAAVLASSRGKDSALDALCRAEALVIGETPHVGDTSGWSGYERARRPWSPDDWAPRCLPHEGWWPVRIDEALRRAERIRERALPRYDEAIRLLDRAVARVAAGKARGVTPRSEANLLLGRYLFHNAAFHLQAFVRAAENLDAALPRAGRGRLPTPRLVYLPTIRLSDCLPAVDGRTVSPAAEAKAARWAPDGFAAYPGNLLDLLPNDVNYRAKRSLARVLERLDPVLRRRAIAMVQAATPLVERYAGTPWAWSVYHSEAFTMVLTVE